MPFNPAIPPGLLEALQQGGAFGKVPSPGLGSLGAQTPAPPPIAAEKPGFFDRMFPERDPNTGKQGGILANPLFRIGLNLLARSGPQARPTSLGQVIAGSIGDYAAQRNEEDGAASNFMKLSAQRQEWGDEQGKRTWAEGLDPEALLALGNPTGNPEAVKAQVQGPLGTPRLGPIPKGYATYAPIITQAEQQNPALPKGLLPAILETESTFNPNAVGPNVTQGGKTWNAKGIAQFAPETAARYGIDPMNPEQAIPTAAIYLREELQRAGGDLDKALAIYGGGFVNGKITPNGAAYVAKVKERMAKYQGGGALPGSPPPPPPAQFPTQAPPPPALSGFSGSGLSMPGAETPGYPVQPQVVPPQSPAVQPQGGAPLPGQASTPSTVGGEAMAPAGEPTAPPLPPLVMDDKGRPTKSSILEALKALPIENRNQLILGAWMKAAGNKKEFAENLGTALLAQGLQRPLRGGVGSDGRGDGQRMDLLLPNGEKALGYFVPRERAYYVIGPNGDTKAPYGTVGTTPSAVGPLNQKEFIKIAGELDEDNLGLVKVDEYMKTVGGTNQGLERWADEISQHWKTLVGTEGELTFEELNRAVAEGKLQSLVGLFRTDVVGPGVMTAQDAIYVMQSLGGSLGILQNKESVKNLLKGMVENKIARMQANQEAYTGNLPYFSKFGFKPRAIKAVDFKKWDELVPDSKRATETPETPGTSGTTPGGHTFRIKS